MSGFCLNLISLSDSGIFWADTPRKTASAFSDFQVLAKPRKICSNANMLRDASVCATCYNHFNFLAGKQPTTYFFQWYQTTDTQRLMLFCTELTSKAKWMSGCNKNRGRSPAHSRFIYQHELERTIGPSLQRRFLSCFLQSVLYLWSQSKQTWEWSGILERGIFSALGLVFSDIEICFTLMPLCGSTSA